MTSKTEAYWLERVRSIHPAAVFETLAADTDRATLFVHRTTGQSVLKAVKIAGHQHADLDVQWRLLTLLSEDPSFPGPKPLARHSLDDEVVELSFLEGAPDL